MYEVEIVTAVASAITHTSSVPQLIRTLRTRSTVSISITFLIQLLTGLSVWQVYGIISHQPIFQLGNGFGLSMWAMIAVVKLYNIVKKHE